MALKKIIICISSNKKILIELDQHKDHNNIIFSNKLNLDEIALLAIVNKARVCILLLPSYQEQKATMQLFPFLSYLNINTLKQKVEFKNQSHNYSISENFILLKQNGSLFYSFVFANLHQDIIEFSQKLKNRFDGVYFSILESGEILKKIFGNANCNKDKILILYTSPNNIVDIRANKHCVPIDIKNTELLHETPASKTGEILQKVEDILTNAKKPLDVAIILSKEMYEIAVKEEVCRNMMLLTPYESAILLGIEDFFCKEEKFCDLLFAHNLILDKSKMAAFCKLQKKEIFTRKYNKIINYLNLVIVLIFIVSLLFLELNLGLYKQKDTIASQELIMAKSRLKEARSNFLAIDSQSREKINLYKFFKSADKPPIERIRKINKEIDIDQAKYQFTSYIESKDPKLEIEIIGRINTKSKNLEDKIFSEYRDYNILAEEKDGNLHLKINK